MPIDPELLEILVCPKSRAPLELVNLPPDLARSLVDKYREHFRDEEPVVSQGLFCATSNLLYPIVSDIPIMVEEDALPGSVIGR